MERIGPQLKEARERLAISASDAAKRLHMRTMFVEAIEREDWKTVGEPVYVRGFIRNYARAVGLDTSALVEAFNDTDYARAATAADEAATASFDAPRMRYPWLLAVMSAIAVLLVVRVAWTIATPTAGGHEELRPQQATAMSVQTADANSATGALAAVRPASATPGGVDLRLELTQPCWLSVSVDGKRVVYETLPAGTIKDFHGIREISLRAGNAGGVVATIDGQDIGTLGGPGQVRDRVFAVRTPPIDQEGPHE